MVVVNYLPASKHAAIRTEKKWFFVATFTAISFYGLARIARVLARQFGISNPETYKAYSAIEILAVCLILAVAVASAEGVLRREWFDVTFDQFSIFHALFLGTSIVIAIALYYYRAQSILFIPLLFLFFMFNFLRPNIQKWFSGDPDSCIYVCDECGKVHSAGFVFCTEDKEQLERVSVPRIIRHKRSRYELKQRVGKGGMGVVYRALDLGSELEVAIKTTIGTYTRDGARRFGREANLLFQLNHPHIVKIYRRFDSHGMGFIVMEYVRAPTLDAILEKKQFSPEDVSVWFKQIFDAVSAAHAINITHRDLKPGNILIAGASGSWCVKLVDFGIAKQRDSVDSPQTFTKPFGTEAYASPEQLEGSSAVDQRADIYSLGVILFEVLTGRLPYLAENNAELRLARLTHAISLDSSSQQDPSTLAAIERCLERDPAERFQTVAELESEVLPYLGA